MQTRDKKGNKGQIWISAVLYILIAAIAMVIILQTGIPLLNGMRDRSSYTKAQDTMVALDKDILEVASEGQGSQRVVPIQVSQGELEIGDTITWTLDTNSRIIEPHASVSVGNVNVFTERDVSTHDAVLCSMSSSEECFILENAKLKVALLKKGTPQDPVPITTDELIQSIEFKETENSISGGFHFGISGDGDTEEGTQGTGWIELSPAGNFTQLDKASVVLHMLNTTDGTTKYQYNLILTLESDADYLSTKVDILARETS